MEYVEYMPYIAILLVFCIAILAIEQHAERKEHLRRTDAKLKEIREIVREIGLEWRSFNRRIWDIEDKNK